MKKVTLTEGQAFSLIAQLRAATGQGAALREIIMPNGKRFADCTGAYCAAVGEAVQNLGLEITDSQ